ncbi:MAG: response regulator [Oscillospiraceae bacterium]|nr:response regulator [Oscillospiraceae bacterium]
MNSDQKIIIIVDDDATALQMGRGVFSGSYRVYTCKSGALMFELLEKIIPNIILLDIEMPDASGYEVLTKLRASEKTAAIPVVLLTALTSEEAELKGFSMGVVDFISKPISAHRLLARVESHLLIESQRHELVNYSLNLEKMVDEKTKSVVELKNTLLKTMAELVEHRDAITGIHIDRTQQDLRVLLDAMKKHGVYADEISMYDEDLIVHSSALHDIGKIAIKEYILFKPGPLTEEEFEEMKKHAAHGEKIIMQIMQNTNDHDFLEHAKTFAISHHEKWDGTGYPHGLKGQDIPLLGRMMAIVDVYDALISDRSYKKALAHDEAVKMILEGSGTHFDPKLTELFIKISDKFEKKS